MSHLKRWACSPISSDQTAAVGIEHHGWFATLLFGHTENRRQPRSTRFCPIFSLVFAGRLRCTPTGIRLAVNALRVADVSRSPQDNSSLIPPLLSPWLHSRRWCECAHFSHALDPGHCFFVALCRPIVVPNRRTVGERAQAGRRRRLGTHHRRLGTVARLASVARSSTGSAPASGRSRPGPCIGVRFGCCGRTGRSPSARPVALPPGYFFVLSSDATHGRVSA